MRKTTALAEIKEANGRQKEKSVLQEADKILLQPIENSTQVMKTHMSKARNKIPTYKYENTWIELVAFIKELAKKYIPETPKQV